jgi:hypothetical protein
MKKIIVLSFISLDGVIQAPCDPTEDTSMDVGLFPILMNFWDRLWENR